MLDLDDLTRLKALAFDLSCEPMIALDPDEQIAAVNVAASQLIGRREADLEGQRLEGVISEIPSLGHRRQKIAEWDQVAAREEMPSNDRADESPFQAKFEQGVGSLVFITQDCHASDEELATTRRQLDLALESARLGTWTFAPATGMLCYSERAREHYGLPPDVAPTAAVLRPLVHPDDWERLTKPYIAGFPDDKVEIEYRVRRSDGEERWLYALGAAVIGADGKSRIVNGILQDITDRKRSEEELGRSRDALYQSKKMAALGTLLAGVSHELNNPLAAIIGQTEMLAEDCAGTPLVHRAAKIRAAAERCGRIVQTFLAMARGRQAKRELLCVNELVKNTLDIAGYRLRRAGIAVRVNLGSGIPLVKGDRDQLHQVLLNLIVNGEQAMSGADALEKVLTITSKSSADGLVYLEIRDSGPGIDDAVANRMFEPFYTTKPVGEGTGIGLSYSLVVAEAHGGKIELLKSTGGAHLRITLPSADSGQAVEDEPNGSLAGKQDSAGGRVLIVDDEPDVAGTLRELVEREGYEVRVASNGAAALEALSADGVDFIFSDLLMPEMNGKAFFKKLQDERPDLCNRFVFVTGDTLGKSTREFLQDCGRPVLEKPFTSNAIRSAIAAILLESMPR